MDCERAREVLWPPEQARLAEGDVVAARAHIEFCAACHGFFETDRALAPAREAVLVQVPPTLRDRVFDSLAARRVARRVPPPAGSKRSQTLAVGVVLIIAMAGTALWFASGNPEAARDETLPFVEDYVRRAVAADRIDSEDPAEVTRFLTRELGTALQPLRADGLTLLGAEICLIDGLRGALVRYRLGDETITHYLIAEPGTAHRPPEQARTHAQAAGLAVVTWSAGGVVHALVADVPTDTLMALARSSRRQ